MRPGPEQQDRDDERADDERADEFALLLPVDLADDRAIPNVLLNRVFDVDAHAATSAFSSTRRRALRARGLCTTSSSSGRTALRVTIRKIWSSLASFRNVCLTMRSSSE